MSLKWVAFASCLAAGIVACSGSSTSSIPNGGKETPPGTNPPGVTPPGTGTGTIPPTTPPGQPPPPPPGTGQPCKVTQDTCPAGTYCQSDDCTSGVCTPIASATATTKERDPHCGCDGITYWNPSIAAHQGISITKSDTCAKPVSCGGFGGGGCPGGAKCNFQLNTALGCGIADQGGTCWFVPDQCPPETTKQHFRSCTGDQCADQCTFINDGDRYYPNAEKCP